ncbi:polysaccharide deacetylase [Colletotrichum caudatum]|nr:polysaccharide deacetylase [Colletotrichum caudatum]
MHYKTVAASLLVAGAAATPFRRQTSNETFCDEDVPIPAPSTTKLHFPPFPMNTTVPGVPSNPGGSYPGSGSGSNPGSGSGSNPGSGSGSNSGSSSNTGSVSGSNSGSSSNTGSGSKPGSGSGSGSSPNTESGSHGSSTGPSSGSQPGSESNSGSKPGKDNSGSGVDASLPSNPAQPPSSGSHVPSYPGKPAPGSSYVPFPLNTTVPTVAPAPALTSIPGVALPTGSVAIPSTTAPIGSNDTATTVSSSSAASSATAPATIIPYGVAISSCTVPGDFALTFDDGPFTYTSHVLDLLAEAGAKATFFVNGQNFGDINDFQDVVKRMDAEGHQIGSHTFDHADLATLGDADIITEMVTLEDALINIVGKYPTYMRPPYFSWNDNTLSILKALEYHVIHADIDTLDYANNAPLGNLTSVGLFEEGVNDGGSISLAHDVHQNTAEYLVPEFLRIIKEKNLRAVTVGECLGDPKANWYKTKRTSTPTATASKVTVTITSTATPTGVIGPGGACGGDQGYVCEAGACCSEYGYCGYSQAYCAAGCQPLFGVCGAVGPVASGSATSSAPVATPTGGATGGVSPDGSCGGEKAYTCPGTTCCSEYGYCGDTTGHCGTGCQPLFGTCS